MAAGEPSPTVAAAASAIIPGLGQATQGDYVAAAEHFTIFAGSLAAAAHYQGKSDFLSDDTRYQHDREIVNQTTLRRDFALRVAGDTALYSSFAAYRDGRSRDTRGYRTPAPKETLFELAGVALCLGVVLRPANLLSLRPQNLVAAEGSYRGG